jgi:LysM repeat protein
MDGDSNLCPFLGFLDDPETAIAYASKMNCCNHARPVVPIALDHQRRFCLGKNFVECPIYKREKTGPLPESLQEGGGFWEKTRHLVPFIALILILVAGFVGSLLLGVIKIPGIKMTPLAPVPVTSNTNPVPTQTLISVTPIEPTLPETVEPTPSETTVIPTSVDPHMSETLIGDSPALLVHKVLEGEGYIWLAQNYNTTEEAIKSINYNLPETLLVNKILVIPVNSSDVAGLPQFSTYTIDTEGVSIETMAQLLRIDVELLKKYNDLPAGYTFIIGEWLLIPH